jgi:hypothetical protein
LDVADTGKTSKFWIGLSDVVTEGVYLWNASGSAASYTFWAAGETSKAGEDCVNTDSVAARNWKESNCGGKNLPLCQKGEFVQPTLV